MSTSGDVARPDASRAPADVILRDRFPSLVGTGTTHAPETSGRSRAWMAVAGYV